MCWNSHQLQMRLAPPNAELPAYVLEHIYQANSGISRGIPDLHGAAQLPQRQAAFHAMCLSALCGETQLFLLRSGLRRVVRALTGSKVQATNANSFPTVLYLALPSCDAFNAADGTTRRASVVRCLV